MGKKVVICVTNFQQFQYLDLLKELKSLNHEVSLSGCQSYCAGCRQQPAAIVEEQWKSFENVEEMRQYMIKD
jgi:DNA-binding transcriptional MerR regulator